MVMWYIDKSLWIYCVIYKVQKAFSGFGRVGTLWLVQNKKKLGQSNAINGAGFHF